MPIEYEYEETPNCPTCDSSDFVEDLDPDYDAFGCIKCGNQWIREVDKDGKDIVADPEDDDEEAWSKFLRGGYSGHFACEAPDPEIETEEEISPTFGIVLEDTNGKERLVC